MNRENEFEEGIKNLLTRLYPDNAHFIYELLQNSEDQKAPLVRFTLTNDSLEFEHNAKRLFSLPDVKSITGFGISTKLDDPTKIGKFGVGFKAVFAYTNTPEIHSGEFHFRIHDLVVPETNGITNPGMAERETRFIFPFDHPKKPPVQAVEEIERGLRALGDNTLLFLHYTGTIEYLLPDGSLGSLERIDHEGGPTEICTTHPGGENTVSHWLHFQKEVEIVDEDGKPKKCRIAIAYSLLQEENTKKSNSKWKIVPLDHGQVSIFFPAEKETSNLRFHVHAPFASTVARDSVRNCKGNDMLRDHLVELVVESLISIRDQGMLTVGFLSVLPNPEDSLSSFYEPFRKKIINAFQDKSLTPTKSGVHAMAGKLYRGPAKIADVLNDDDLSLLTNYELPLWAANPPQQNQRDDRFLKSLKIDPWGWSELVKLLGSSDIEVQQRIENWITQKDDTWLKRFYALLGEACDTHNEYIYLVNLRIVSLRIVRVETSQAIKHVVPEEAFFLDEEKTPPTDICIVKPTTYSTGRSEAQNKSARSFLEKIGVRPFDAKAVIELRLTHYKSPPEQIGKEYYKDLKQFIAFWKKNPTETDLFSRHTFLLNDEMYWCKPEELCLDSPYIETGLAALTKVHSKNMISDEYQDILSESQLKNSVEFLKGIGTMHELKVESTSTDYNPHTRELQKDHYDGAKFMQNTGTDEDYTILNIKKYIATKSVSVSRLIWNALIYADNKSARARFKPNRKCEFKETESQLVYHLKRHAWIPDNSGNFRKPQDMTEGDLLDDFPFNDQNSLLTEIGFGENAKKTNDDYKRRKEAAISIGIPVEMADYFSTLSSEEREKECKEWKAIVKNKMAARKRAQCIQQNRVPYHKALDEFFSAPGGSKLHNSEGGRGSSRNTSRRRGKTSEEIVAAIENEGRPEARFFFSMRKKWKGKNDLVRKALVEWYNGQCQICGNTFIQQSGEPYFEGLYLVSYTNAEWLDRVGNVLCLCPWHSAMFQFGSKEVDEDIIQQVMRLKVQAEGGYDRPTIHMKLCDKQIEIEFAENHLIDLQEMIRASQSAE